ncbi:ribosome assembly factor SBDS [Candidatus Woesearchaeota archaeon]|nr:ribosome assembly factor SBDS [Candidatus Woesearchaeota archaeon]
MMKGSELYEKEHAHFNVARLHSGGERFEVIVEPDSAIAFRNGSLADVRAALKYEKIFSDAKKGFVPSEASIKTVFGTDDAVKVAEAIIRKGEIQLSSKYRESLREAKLNRLVEMIHRNAIDPKTGFPHPATRIRNAFAEAKVRIDERKSAEQQLDEVLNQLRPVLPIRFETRRLQMLIPAQYASKSFSTLKALGRISRDSWQADGSLLAVIDVPAGLQQDLIDQINKITRGDVDVKILEGQ